MNNVIRLKPLQLAWVTAAVLVSAELMYMPREIIRLTGVDAWLTHYFPLLYALSIAFVLYRLSEAYPGCNLYEIIVKLLGRGLGTVLNLGLIVLFWFVLMLDINAFAKFVNMVLLPRTPEEIIIFLFILLLMYYGFLGTEPTVRVNDLMFPWNALALLLLPLLLFREFELIRLEPVLTGSLRSYGAASLVNFGWYGDIIVLGVFMHTIANSRRLHAALRHGLLLAAFFMSLFSLTTLTVLGSTVAGQMTFPVYSLAEQIQLTDFLDRLELYLISIWVPLLTVKLVITFIAVLYGLAHLTGQSAQVSRFSKPFGWFLLITTVLSFESLSQVLSFGAYSLFILNVGFGGMLMLLLMIGLAIRGKGTPGRKEEQLGAEERGNTRGDGEQPDAGRREQERSSKKARQEGAPQPSGDGSGSKNGRDEAGSRRSGTETGGWLSRMSRSGWNRTSNLLLAAAFVLLLAGKWVALDYNQMARICASGYLLCLVLAVFTTYMENQSQLPN